jgi:hypothetical protein
MVMGDHSWRTELWKPTEEWTEEDQETSAGKAFDDRPAMVVKLARENGGALFGAHIDAAFPAERTRGMLEELMAGRIRTEKDLERWVEGQAR